MPLAVAAGDRASPADRDGLFAAYREQLELSRDEAGYVTVVPLRGETLAAMLARAGTDVPDEDHLHARLTEEGGLADGLATPMRAEDDPAQGIDVMVAGDGLTLARLRLSPEAGVSILAALREGSWQVTRTDAPVQIRHVTAASMMTDSLFGSGARAGVPREIMVRLANLFLYDVDFVRDIQAGDRFEVVYETRVDGHGRSLGTGDIVFAAMTWRGGREAKGYYRFDGANGANGAAGGSAAVYFDDGGASAQRLLMKTPIDGARVTSRFGPRRHPTLGYTKAHKGVDFGARAGTPIMAAGDGTVVRAAPLGSYGNFLLIRHSNGYETAYAHLRGFADGVKAGMRVRQGDVVAYVGSTGRSTGPHLHYEVRRKGRQVNPMNLDVATGSVLAGHDLSGFEAVRDDADAMRARPLAVPSGD